MNTEENELNQQVPNENAGEIKSENQEEIKIEGEQPYIKQEETETTGLGAVINDPSYTTSDGELHVDETEDDSIISEAPKRLIYQGKVIAGFSDRIVNEKPVTSITLEDGSNVDITEEEYSEITKQN